MKRSIVVTSSVALLTLLGGAAFVGGRLLGGPDVSSDKQGAIVSGPGGEKIGTGVTFETEPADEMPDTPPDVAGIFVRREDNSLFVGTGNLSGVLVDGKWELRHDGLAIEVLTTHDTLIYHDDIFEQLGGVAPSGPIKEVLKPGSLDEIDETSSIQAWGERRGDRLVARVLVFAPNPDF